MTIENLSNTSYRFVQVDPAFTAFALFSPLTASHYTHQLHNVVKSPDSSFDATMKAGKYTLDKLPWKSGAQFAVTMDDGYGLFVSPPIRLRALTRPSGPHLPTGRVLEVHP